MPIITAIRRDGSRQTLQYEKRRVTIWGRLEQWLRPATYLSVHPLVALMREGEGQVSEWLLDWTAFEDLTELPRIVGVPVEITEVNWHDNTMIAGAAAWNLFRPCAIALEGR